MDEEYYQLSLGLSEEKRGLGVFSFGDDWFECPNGHPFRIREYWEAMRPLKCPVPIEYVTPKNQNSMERKIELDLTALLVEAKTEEDIQQHMQHYPNQNRPREELDHDIAQCLTKASQVPPGAEERQTVEQTAKFLLAWRKAKRKKNGSSVADEEKKKQPKSDIEALLQEAQNAVGRPRETPEDDLLAGVELQGLKVNQAKIHHYLLMGNYIDAMTKSHKKKKWIASQLNDNAALSKHWFFLVTEVGMYKLRHLLPSTELFRALQKISQWEVANYFLKNPDKLLWWKQGQSEPNKVEGQCFDTKWLLGQI